MFLTILATLSITSAPAETHTLPEIVAVGDRFIRDEGSKSVITLEEIEKSEARTVGELLKRTAGVDFGLNSPGSAYATIRGSSSSQVLVIIDGVRVNDPSSPTRAFDFSSLDLAQIERIEILKGPQSVEFGGEGIAGVILITTKRSARTGTSFRFREEAGSRESNRSSLLFGQSLGSATLLNFNLSQEDLGGISAAAVPQGDVDSTLNRNGTASIQIQPIGAPWRLDLRSSLDHGKQDLDDAPFQDDPNYVARTRSLRNSLQGAFEFSPSLEMQVLLTHFDQRRAYDDLLDAVSSSTLSQTYRGKNQNLEAGLKGRPSVHREWAAGLSFQRESFDLMDPTQATVRSQTRNPGVYAQGASALDFVSLDWTRLILGIRHDRPEDLASRTTYQAGIEATVSESTQLHARTATGYKIPSLSSRFDPVFGNPELRPERSSSYEIGGSTALAADHSLALTGFLTRYDDLIGFDFATSKAANTAKAEVRGAELSGTSQIGFFKFLPHLTYLRAYDRNTREELARRAKWKGGLITQFAWTDTLESEVEFLAKTSRIDFSGGPRTPGYGIINAALNWRPRSRLAGRDDPSPMKYFLRIENLLGKEYQEVRGYNSPGFGIFGGFQVGI